MVGAVMEAAGHVTSAAAKNLVRVAKGRAAAMAKNVPAALGALEGAGVAAPTHTAGAAAVLACIEPGPGEAAAYLGQAAALLSDADPEQAALVPRQVADVARRVADAAVASGTVQAAVLPLRAAVRLLQRGDTHVLTAAHGPFLRVAIRAKAYGVAAREIAPPAYEVQGKDDGMGVLDYLVACYYSGIVFAAARQYGRAVESFQHAVTAPSQSLSAVQVAAYKKLVLCQLIGTGTFVDVPQRMTSREVYSSMGRNCREYAALLQAARTNPQAFHEAVLRAERALRADGNLGLARLARDSLLRFSVVRLTDTYVTLSLADMARASHLSGPGEAERVVRDMIADGAISARISKRDGMVSFTDGAPGGGGGGEAGLAAEMEARIREVMEVNRRAAEKAAALRCDPRFAAATLRAGAGGSDPFGAFEEFAGAPGSDRSGLGGRSRGRGGMTDDDAQMSAAIAASLNDL